MSSLQWHFALRWTFVSRPRNCCSSQGLVKVGTGKLIIKKYTRNEPRKQSDTFILHRGTSHIFLNLILIMKVQIPLETIYPVIFQYKFISVFIIYVHLSFSHSFVLLQFVFCVSLFISFSRGFFFCPEATFHTLAWRST